MSKLKLGCWVAGAVMLLTIVTIQIVKPVASQAGWDNVNALMANTLLLDSIEEDGDTHKTAHNEPRNGAHNGINQPSPNNSASDNTGSAQLDTEQEAQNDKAQQGSQQVRQHDTQQESQNETEHITQTPPAINQSSQSGLININSATVEQLDTLPGIGPSKAKAIVEYRIKYGDFRSLEQIMEVKGIGPKIFAKMKGQIII